MSQRQQDQSYSWVYGKLVRGETDLVGAIAYVLYKQQKIQSIQSFEEDGEKISEEQLVCINRLLCTEEAIRSYQDRAEILVSGFLTEALEKQIKNFEADSDNRIYEKLKSLINELDSKLSVLSKQKTIKERCSEALMSVMYSLFVIALIGGAFKAITWIATFGDEILKKMSTG